MFGINLSWILNISLVRVGLASTLYLGPETLMPLASILAAVVGFLLIFGRAFLKSVKKVLGKGGPTQDVTAYVEPEEDEDGGESNG